MRGKFLFVAAGVLAVAWQLGSAGRLSAHGSGWSQDQGFTVLLSFYYANQSPISYSEVEVFSPADPQIPYQKGRSDRNGFFAFRPDAAGRWSFSASDAQGHLSRGEVEITAEQLNPAAAEGSARAAAPEPSPPLATGGAPANGVAPLNIVLGLSLIANLALIFWRRKKTAGRN